MPQPPGTYVRTGNQGVVSTIAQSILWDVAGFFRLLIKMHAEGGKIF